MSESSVVAHNTRYRRLRTARSTQPRNTATINIHSDEESEPSSHVNQTRDLRLRTIRSTQSRNTATNNTQSNEENEAAHNVAHNTRNRRHRTARSIQPRDTVTDNIHSDEESGAASRVMHTRNRTLRRTTRSSQPRNTATNNIQSYEESGAESEVLAILPSSPLLRISVDEDSVPLLPGSVERHDDSDETNIYESRSPSNSSPDIDDLIVAYSGSPEYNPTTPSDLPPGYARSPLYTPLVEDVPNSPVYLPAYPQDPVEDIGEGTANQQIPQEIPRIEPRPPAQPSNQWSADVAIQPKSTNSSVPTSTLNVSTVSEGEDSLLCSICMDPLTNSGKHRTACLKCGHIFGHSCVERWIKVGCYNGARRCPTCNERASLKDIRVLYLSKVFPLDTVERDRLIREKEELSSQQNFAERDLQRCKLMYKLNGQKYEEKLSKLEIKYHEALHRIEQLNKGEKIALPGVEYKRMEVDPTLLHTVELSKEGGCRVFAFNPFQKELVVSQPSGNTFFAGYGVRVLNTEDFQPSRFIYLHHRMIRDLSFHLDDRNLLLSVSMDHSAKLFDFTGNTTVHTFKGENPLWSCCWDMTNPHLLLLGSHLGKVYQYDRRMMDQYVNLWETPNNMTPVVALASTPSVASTPFPQGGFISCRLNRIFTYSRHGEKYSSQELNLHGPFMSMKYEYTTQSLFTSSRPSSRNPNAEICHNQMDVDAQGNVCLALIHTFNCGTTARFLTRMTTIPVLSDTVVVGHHERGRTVNLWSTTSGSLIHSIPTKDPIIDLTGISLPDNKRLLATLSDKKVSLYSVS